MNETTEAEVKRLRSVVAYYANPRNWRSGDAPGHIYVIDDDGRLARETLGLPARPTDEFPVAWACDEIEREGRT